MERNRIEAKVELFRPLLLETIKPTRLLKYLNFLSSDEKSRIEDTKKKEGSEKAASLLLDIITQRHDVRGRWNILIGALENDDFDSVAKCLSDSFAIDSPELRKLINVFSRVVAIHVNPANLLNALRSQNLITKQDAEEIEAEGASKGRVAAIIVMLDGIPRQVKNWHDVFLRILDDNGHTELVNEIDEDFLEKGCSAGTPNRPVINQSVYANAKQYGLQLDQTGNILINGFNSQDRIDFSTCLPPNRNIPAQRMSGSLSEPPAQNPGSGKENASRVFKSTTTPNRPGRKLLTVKDLQDALDKIGFTPLPIPAHNTNFRNAELLCLKEVPLKRKIMKTEHNSQPPSHDPPESLTSVKTVDDSQNTCTNNTSLPVHGNGAREPQSLNSSISDNNAGSLRDLNYNANNLFMTWGNGNGSSDNVVSESESLTSVKTVDDSQNTCTNDTSLPVHGNGVREPQSLNSSISDNNAGSLRDLNYNANNLFMTWGNGNGSSDNVVSESNNLEDTTAKHVYSAEPNQDRILYRHRPMMSQHVGRNEESNMQRMTNVSEAELDRRRRQIVENRREDMPNCLGLNINDGQESVIDNTDAEERRLSDCGDDESDDESDDDDSITQQEVEDIELRGYQKELVAPGLEGKNCMVVAPTGSGKTRVALKIIQEHIKQRRRVRNPKVVFLVEQSALAEQQAKECEKYFGDQVKVITGGIQQKEKYQEIAGWLERRSILVVTAQLLVNALKDGDVRITQFTLLIFDECHHTNIEHAFNKIMHAYLELKLRPGYDKTRLPQVIGLTASVGVGKAKNRNKAVEWIQKMMAHLDAEEIVTVQENILNLRQYAKEAKQKTIKTAPRRSELFGNIVADDMMKEVELKIRNSHHAKLIPGSQTVLTPPVRKYGDEYTQWLSKINKQTRLLEDDEARRFIIACLDYLKIFHKALIIYNDARVKDALSLMEVEIHKINEHARKNEIEQWLEHVFTDYQEVLKLCKHREEQSNPKLDKLKSLLIDKYRRMNDSRFLIFIKTRDLVDAVHNWMMETPELRGLNPRKFVGAQASVQKGGMTRNEQVDALALFREGIHKVIIATSVAEEGLDISKCNLVFRYDYVSNEIARVQVRGRARAENSECILITGADGVSARREELNEMKEGMMLRAIQQLQQMIRTNKRAVMMEIENIQMEEFDKRELKATENTEKMTQNDRIFELRCICGKHICYSFNVKVIQNAHHAIVDPDIMSAIEAKKTYAAKYSDQHIQAGVGIICCKECMRSLGNVSIYNGTEFPILKIESVVIVDTMSDERFAKKSWKLAPFLAYPLTPEDQRIWRQSPTCKNILPKF